MVNGYKIADGKEMTPELLAEYIAYHDRQVTGRYRELHDAYLTEYDIGKRPPKERWKPNNQLVASFPRFLVSTFSGFFTGIAPTISADDDSINAELQYITAYANITDLIAELAKDTSIYGHAYMMAYVDSAGEIGAAVTTPMDSFVITDEGIVPDILYYVHYYTDSENVRRGSISDGSTIKYFVIDPVVRFTGEERPHGFDGVPVVEFAENTEMVGLYEGQLTLIKGYSKALSYELDDIQSFASAILKILGAKLTSDEMRELRENQIINFEGSFDGSGLVVDFLSKPDGNVTQENFLNRCERLIFDLSMVSDISAETFGNASGIALKYRLLAMYNLAAAKERKFKIGLQKFFKLICSNPVTALDADDYLDMTVTFYRNLPSNLLEEAQIAAQLTGITSQETALGVLSNVQDVKAEMERKKQEDEDSISLGYPTDRINENE